MLVNRLFVSFVFLIITSLTFASATFKHTATPMKDGAKLKLDFSHTNSGNKVTVVIFTEVTDDKGDTHLIEIAELDHQHTHKSSSETRTFDLDYNKINAELARKAPGANLQVGPGTKMWVMGRWIFYPNKPNPYDGSMLGKNHYFGGTGKGGAFTLPTPSNGWTGGTTPKNKTKGNKGNYYGGGTVTDLDTLNNVGADITNQFPEMRGSALGSRYERELKLHVDLAEHANIAKKLDDLVNDPAKVEKLFGAGATMHEDTTYVGKPMVDEYQDTKDFDGAANGTAIRFRTGKGVTKLNVKPNDGVYRKGGIFDRVEYEGEKITSSKAVERFADSNHPANFMALLRDIAPSGTNPSDFFEPAMKITDVRRKYKIKLPTGEEVELSLDKYKARQMKGSSMVGPTVEVGQLEVEIDHMGASGSTNVNTGGQGNQRWNSQWDVIHGSQLSSFLKGLKGRASIGGTAAAYVFHGEKDFKLTSPMHKANKSTFANTNKIFSTLKKHLFPKGPGASGQKYAVAAAALGLLKPKDWAPSVKKMVHEELGRAPRSAAESIKCLDSMVKVGT